MTFDDESCMPNFCYWGPLASGFCYSMGTCLRVKGVLPIYDLPISCSYRGRTPNAKVPGSIARVYDEVRILTTSHAKSEGCLLRSYIIKASITRFNAYLSRIPWVTFFVLYTALPWDLKGILVFSWHWGANYVFIGRAIKSRCTLLV